MIFKRFFTLFYSLFLAVPAVTPTTEPGLSAFKVTPLYLDGSITEVSFTVRATKKAVTKVSFYLINDLYPNGVLIFSNSYTAIKTETFEYNNAYTRPGTNKIKIETTISKNTKSITQNLDVANGKSIKIDSQKYTYISTSSSFTYTQADGLLISKQKLVFENFESIYMPSYYHKIDTKNFKITYSGTFPAKLTCGAANLVISNRNGAFNCFQNANGFADIPLDLSKNGNVYELVPSIPLYVNQTTLEMSTTPKDGYVQTQYIYFPRNEKRFENEYTCSIVIDKLGTDKNTYITNFKYRSERNILGDCHNSEYCVINSN